MNLLRPKQVAQRLGCTTNWIYKLVQRGKFPEPFKLGPRHTVWEETVVNDWITKKKEMCDEAQ